MDWKQTHLLSNNRKIAHGFTKQVVDFCRAARVHFTPFIRIEVEKFDHDN